MIRKLSFTCKIFNFFFFLYCDLRFWFYMFFFWLPIGSHIHRITIIFFFWLKKCGKWWSQWICSKKKKNKWNRVRFSKDDCYSLCQISSLSFDFINDILKSFSTFCSTTFNTFALIIHHGILNEDQNHSISETQRKTHTINNNNSINNYSNV